MVNSLPLGVFYDNFVKDGDDKEFYTIGRYLLSSRLSTLK